MIINLHIYTWQGMSISARHYYGELKAHWNSNLQDVKLTHALTAAEARANNVAYAKEYPGDRYPTIYCKGDLSDGFETEAQIIALALKTWQTHFPNGKLLLLGDTGQAGPQAILAGAPPVIRRRSKQWAKREAAFDYGGRDERKINLLHAQWHNILKEYGGIR